MESICYATGEEVCRGDHVLLDGEPSIVEEVISTNEKMAQWGLDEPGLMYTNEWMGRVFESLENTDWDTLEFLQRQ